MDLVFAEMSVWFVALYDPFKWFAEAKTLRGGILEKRNNRNSLHTHLQKNAIMQCFIHHEEKTSNHNLLTYVFLFSVKTRFSFGINTFQVSY